MLLLTRRRNSDFGNRQKITIVEELFKMSGESDFAFILLLVHLKTHSLPSIKYRKIWDYLPRLTFIVYEPFMAHTEFYAGIAVDLLRYHMRKSQALQSVSSRVLIPANP
jgi:hypothetical protein